LDIIEDMHLLQPSSNLQLSRKSPDALLKHALRVIRHGYGFPSIFNTDTVVEEQLRQGKTLEDARAGGCSGCVETGAFGKEAYILTGYFNLVKILELVLHDGVDLRTGKLLGIRTGDPAAFASFDDLLAAFRKQLHHFIEIKMRGNLLIEQMYAAMMPATFLSVITDDCILKGKDYNAGGARYNNSYIQFVGIGSLTDSLAAMKQKVFDEKKLSVAELVRALDADFHGFDNLRLQLVNKTPKYGNDDDYADRIMTSVVNTLVEEIDGRPNAKGGRYRVEMLPTTCHVYFGSVTGAMPDGRKAGLPLSEGISPVQGADRLGPTAVVKSAGKLDHVKTGGTLLNMKFTPSLLADDNGIDKLAHLVRSYFKMDGHHVQFNVVRAEVLRKAQASPEAYRDLIVRVAGYSDYFCDLSQELQEEIITRTEHTELC
jgi:formate C-acetyltransferase